MRTQSMNSILSCVAAILSFAHVSHSVLRAQDIAFGGFQFPSGVFATSALEIDPSPTMTDIEFGGGASTLNEALAGFSKDTFLFNIGFDDNANLFQLNFETNILNRSGPDFVLFDIDRFAGSGIGDNYEIAVRPTGEQFTTPQFVSGFSFINTGVLLFPNPNPSPSSSTHFGAPLDLTSFGIADNTKVDAITIRALPGTAAPLSNGMAQGDPTMVGVLNPFIIFERFSQGDEQWKDDILGAGTNTIGTHGCAVSSLAMVLNNANVSEDPQTLNNLLRQPGSNGFLGGDNLVWSEAVKEAANNKVWNSVSVKTSSASQLQDLVVNQGLPTVVKVTNPDTGTGHFVVVTGMEGSEFTIADPGYAGRTLLSYYGNIFEMRGYLTDSPLSPAPIIGELGLSVSDVVGASVSGTDISEIIIAVSGLGEGTGLLLVAPDGNKTGFEIGTGLLHEEIPYSTHFIDQIGNIETNTSHETSLQQIHVMRPAAGEYQIQLSGIESQTQSYSLYFATYGADGNLLSQGEISSTIAPGATEEFAIVMVPEPSTLWLSCLGIFILARG